MPNVKVKQLQTLTDIALLTSGDATAFVQLALLNGLSLTDDLVSGQLLTQTDVVDADIVQELINGDARPASAVIPGTDAETLQGIGYWAIGLDFIVS